MQTLNPSIQVTTHPTRITPENAMSLIQPYDIVLDGSDNALTRYLINDCCVALDKPLVSGASVKWEGQVTCYNLPDGPCYRCLYPECPKSSSMMSCNENGVFPTAPGMVGTVVATECAKVLLGLEGVLKQKLLLIDLLNMRMKVVRVRSRKKDCFCKQLRGNNQYKIQDIDYAYFVGASCKMYLEPLEKQFNVQWDQLTDLLRQTPNAKILDMRPKTQHGVVNIEEIEGNKVIHTPLADLKFMEPNELTDLFGDKNTVFVFCRSGRTSVDAVRFLHKHNFNALNIEGGIKSLMSTQHFDEKLIKNL